MATIIIRPTGDNDPGWETPEPPHFQLVDETVADDDTTVISTETAAINELFTFAAHGLPPGTTVNSVIISYRVKAVSESDRLKCRIGDTVNGTSVIGTDEITPPGDNDYANYVSATRTTNPATGIAWTLTDITNLVAGVSNQTVTGLITMTQVYATVDYTAPVANSDGAGAAHQQAYFYEE